MRATHRRDTASPIDRLLAAPHAFEFVQAVSLLLDWLARQGVPPAQALRGCLRFENSLRLAFPASEIEAIACTPAPDEPAAHRFTITPAFMGLLGAHGALPLQVSERIVAWQGTHGDAAPRAFLDLISGRMLALRYGAWQKYRIEHRPAGGADRLRPLLLALAGDAPGADPDAANAPLDNLTAHFAGMLGQGRCPGVVLERMLAGFFGVAVQLDEAVGFWDRLAPGEQAALGVNVALGENLLLGERSWRPDLRARLRIGPLDAAAFARFLPTGAASAALRAILRRFAEPGVGFEVQLILRAQDVRPARLAGRGAAPARLGRDGFLVAAGAGAGADRADMRYLVAPMAPLAPARPARPAAA